jgi:hypothetical protein
MVDSSKDKMKEERFKKIATRRTKRILEDLRRLGNCSNKGNYYYSKEDVDKIFTAIQNEYTRVKALFERKGTDFTL